MATTYSERVPTWFWLAVGLGLLWNLIGVAFYLGHVGVLSGPFATPPGLREMPSYALAAFAIGVWGSVLGSILMLMRNRLARPLLWIALAALIVDWGWVFYGSGQGVTPMGLWVLTVALLLAILSQVAVKRGWLR
jgi:hypothetical protein